ncbi:zinc finger, CCHC-type containing protein [Tanacetum coccineum]
MAAATMKYMASNFVKLDKFKGVDFQRWQKKMHFLLSSMSMVYVLTTPIPKDGGDDATMEQIKKRAKWDNNDYNVESSKELWDPLEAKYMAEDASSKKFLVRIPKFFTMTHFKTILEKYNELLEYLEGYDKPKGNNVARALQFSIGGAITTPHRNNYTRDDPKTFDEAIKSQDVAFWKEAINDEMDSIMGNNTWVLANLPPGCKPLGCKWIFKRKLKVDGTIEKFKARLVIQGFNKSQG